MVEIGVLIAVASCQSPCWSEVVPHGLIGDLLHEHLRRFVRLHPQGTAGKVRSGTINKKALTGVQGKASHQKTI